MLHGYTFIILVNVVATKESLDNAESGVAHCYSIITDNDINSKKQMYMHTQMYTRKNVNTSVQQMLYLVNLVGVT